MTRPTYLRKEDDYLLDEMCACGHLKSQHGSLLHKGHNYKEHNAGSCCAGTCGCAQFTWARFVRLEEYAEIIKSQRPLQECTV